VISIDHLPSLVPIESSKEFGDALISHLVQFDASDVWTRAKQLFINKTAHIRDDLGQVSVA
jgi:saccharopine dehydrogenase (NAD+, L-lysine-forming)